MFKGVFFDSFFPSTLKASTGFKHVVMGYLATDKKQRKATLIIRVLNFP